MQNLKQYIELITQFKPKKEELTLLMGGKDTKLFHFCEGIINKHFKTEGDAAKHLYGNTPNYPPFKTLKSELKKRLVNAILTLDYKQSALNDVQQVYYTCQKNWAAINILTGRSKIDAAIDLAQTTLSQSIKYELTDLVVSISNLLIFLYRIYHPFNKRINEYEKIHFNYSQQLKAENLSLDYYDDITKNHIRVRASLKHLHDIAIQYHNELKQYLNENSSYKLYFYANLIRIFGYTSVNDYQSVLNITEEMIKYFDKKPFELKTQTLVILHYNIASCIQLKLFDEGTKAAKRSITLVPKGTYNWYRDRLLYTQLCLHTERYQEAWENILDVIQHRSFDSQNEVIKDEINIYLSFLKYLIQYGKIKATRKEKEVLDSFDLSGYINIAPSFHKDKRGMNIPALISQILWLLAEKNYESVHFRVLALNKYKSRHINKEEETYRTNLFIKMVNTLEKCEYRRRRVERKTSKTFDELKNTALNINNNALQTEVLPYEIIWSLMLNAMS